MADTAATSPGTMADDATVGTKVWGSPDYAKADDTNNTYASSFFDSPWYSHYLKATNFGFSIPSGATINGVLVEILERESSSSGVMKDSEIRLVKADGSIGTTNRSVGATWSTTEAYVSYGSNSDLWGETLTSTDINDVDFGAVLSIYSQSGDFTTASVDHIRITVYYTTSAAGPANLKSLNTNIKSNIKSYNTNILSNIKSINTNI